MDKSKNTDLNLYQKNTFKIFFLVLIFLINIKYSQSFEYFKSIPLGRNNYYIVTTDKLLYYDAGSNTNNTVHTFEDDQKILTKEEFDIISFNKFNQANAPICLLIIKHFVYAISENGVLFCIKNLTQIIGYYPSLVNPITCTSTYCYYIIGVTNLNNSLNIHLYGNKVYSCDSGIYHTVYLDSDSDCFSCHLYETSTDITNDTLICFYEKYNTNEIIATTYNINLTEEKIIEDYSTSISNNGAKIIKSYISDDNSESLVCYINDNNNCNCLKYYINTKAWDIESNVNTIYLKDCEPKFSSLNLEYFDTLNEFLLYCQQSSNQYSVIKLNSNYEIIDDEENGIYQIYEEQFENCSEYSISSLFLDENNDIKIMVKCDDNYVNYKVKKFIYIPTTIITFETSSTTINNEIIVIQENCLKTKEEIIDNLKEFMENYDKDKVYEIFGDDYRIKISPLNEQTYKNISTYINMTNCENVLREIDELSLSNFSLFQIEIYNSDENILINGIEYSLFDEGNEKIDLSVCKNELIQINYQIKNESFINITKIKYYAEKGIDIYDIEDDFFNDICYPYSEEDSDLILRDRISDIYENYSLCEENCEYEEINTTTGKIYCNCQVKTEIDTDIEIPKLSTVILDTFSDSNLGVVKCYNLVFKGNKFENIGFWIFTILILGHIPIYIIYFIKNVNPIKEYISGEIKKFNYLDGISNPVKKGKNLRNSQIIKKKKEKDIDEINIYTKKSSDKYKLKYEITNNMSKSKFGSSLKIPNLSSKNNSSRYSLSHNYKINSKNKNNNKNPMLLLNYNVVNKNYINVIKDKNKISKNDDQKFMRSSKLLKKNRIKFSPENYFLIHIDANNTSSIKPPESNSILDNYEYEAALKYDERNFLRIFYICVLCKENIINLFFFKNPLNLKIIQISFFMFVFSSDLAFNIIFYSNKTISEKYHYEGESIIYFSLVNNIVESLCSALFSLLIADLFQYLVDSRGKYEDVFRKEEKKMRENRKYKVSKKTKIEILKKINVITKKLKYKIIIYFIIEFFLMLLFYYFVTAFCEVYKKTQISWLMDFLSSCIISFFTQIIFSLVLAIFYIISIRYKLKYLYKIVIFIYNL